MVMRIIFMSTSPYGDTSFNVSSAVITVTSATTLTYSNPGPNAGFAVPTGAEAVSATPSISPYMLINVDPSGNPETVMVLTVIPGVGFTANQTLPHVTPMTYSASFLSGNIAASTTATITRHGVFNFTGTGAAVNTSLLI